MCEISSAYVHFGLWAVKVKNNEAALSTADILAVVSCASMMCYCMCMVWWR